MLGSARGEARTPELARGIGLHHATDAAFHGIPEFVRLVAEARTVLTASGLGRGAARAAAHIGVELLLDEVLVDDSPGRSAYLGALDYACSGSLLFDWSNLEHAGRLSKLAAALAERGLPEALTSPGAVAARIRRALANHPRLALAGPDEGLVSDWVVAARGPIVGCTKVILTELRSRLQAAWVPSTGSTIPPRLDENSQAQQPLREDADSTQ